MLSLQSSEAFLVKDAKVEAAAFNCSVFQTSEKECIKSWTNPVTLKAGDAIYFGHDNIIDLFFKILVYTSKNNPLELRLQGNFPRHFNLRLYLKYSKSEEIVEIKTNFEAYRKLVPYPFTILTLDLTGVDMLSDVELIG